MSLPSPSTPSKPKSSRSSIRSVVQPIGRRGAVLLAGGTLYHDRTHYVLSLPHEQVVDIPAAELAELQQHREDYFDLERTERGPKGDLILHYLVPEEYVSFLRLQKAHRLLKLRLLYTLLRDQPLQGRESYLVPENLWYHRDNVDDVRLLYRSNGWLPQPTEDAIEQYKLLGISLLSGYSIPAVRLRKSKILYRQGADELLLRMESARDLDELYTILHSALIAAESTFYAQLGSSATAVVKATSTPSPVYRYWAVAATVIIILGGAVTAGLQHQAQQQVAQAQVAAQQQAQQQVAQVRQQAQQIMTAALAGDTGKLVDILKAQHAPASQIAQALMQAGQYQQALQTDPAIAKTLIDTLYSSSKYPQILALKANDPYVTTTQAALELSDVNALKQLAAKTQDPQLLVYIGRAIAEHGDFASAKGIAGRLSGDQRNALVVYSDRLQIRSISNASIPEAQKLAQEKPLQAEIDKLSAH